MNANNAVEQAAGLILVLGGQGGGAGRAPGPLGVPGRTQAHDTYALSHRPDLRSSGAIRLAAQRLFALAGATTTWRTSTCTQPGWRGDQRG